ncbi:cript family protein [Xylona heveae TC161]|uniref:Cysteine-rich PDZ-binding protein n=1 Tax=Xylona heveae (strain CBS 132557 / TC161) TaxID=1328760 RepID=A0A165FYB4_XYLHT|nr:cript family protein [Xylona heveae TC161]KZF21528.1 cript family protein [Xylona heveae TC161]
MVCSKCQKLQKTELATPGVKRKSEMYYGSPATSSASSRDKSSSATLGSNGIGKSKLLSKTAKNPMLAYGSSCKTCKKKTPQGHMYCQPCAYKAAACASCGKTEKKKSSGGAPVVQGQKYSSK